MTWVGWYIVFICLFAFLGNAFQLYAYHQAEDKKVAKLGVIGVVIGFILNLILLWAVLFIGTGDSLFVI